MVFEDNPLVTMDAEEALQRLGFSRVLSASSEDGAVALATYEAVDFALVAARTWDGCGDMVAEILDRRAIPFGFGCDFVDGSDRPDRWRAKPYLTRPFGERELADLIDRLGIAPA